MSVIDGPPMTSAEVAKMLRLSIETVCRYARQGKLKGYRTSSQGNWRFSESEVRAFLRRLQLGIRP